ncbi:hypothetical protein ABIC89_005563 [Variovorax boronicumulans]
MNLLFVFDALRRRLNSPRGLTCPPSPGLFVPAFAQLLKVAHLNGVIRATTPTCLAPFFSRAVVHRPASRVVDVPATAKEAKDARHEAPKEFSADQDAVRSNVSPRRSSRLRRSAWLHHRSDLLPHSGALRRTTDFRAVRPPRASARPDETNPRPDSFVGGCLLQFKLAHAFLSVAWPGKLNLIPARRSHYDEKNNNDFRKRTFAVAWTA